jgi:prophage maintenance system killer protein
VFIAEIRQEVMIQLDALALSQKEKDSQISEEDRVDVTDNKIVNKKFQELQAKCFDEIENIVFKLIHQHAYKLTSNINTIHE